MVEHDILGIRFFTYELFDEFRNVINVVTSRQRGRSQTPYDSLNLGFHVGDDPNAVLDNRAIVAQLLGFEPEDFTLGRQVHGAEIAVVGSADRGRGAVVEDDALPDTDAMITRAPGVPLTVMVADCVAVSLYDPENGAMGIAHAGWAGTAKRIVQRTVGKMTDEFGTRPAGVVAGIGPSVGPCHYPVGDDVIAAFAKEFSPDELSLFFEKHEDGTTRLDLWQCNRWQLLQAGLRDAMIETAGMCTVCRNDLFYSRRGGEGATGRYAGIVMLQPTGARPY